MNKEEAQKILSKVKKQKLGYGNDLGVVTRAAESILLIALQSSFLFLILSNNDFFKGNLIRLSALVILFIGGIIMLLIRFRKIAKVRDYMLIKKAFYINDIEEANQRLEPTQKPSASL